MTKQTVLVVDDDADIRAFLKINFESWGFEVVTAEDGAEAAASAADIDADLIPLDMNMPSVSGLKPPGKFARRKSTARPQSSP